MVATIEPKSESVKAPTFAPELEPQPEPVSQVEIEPQPEPGHEPVGAARSIMRVTFKWGNKLFMVPLMKMGLGKYMGSPATGYIMLLRTRGRKSGIVRATPLNYSIRDGCVYCLAGFGKRTDWLRNIEADPRVEVMLPSAAFAGHAEVLPGGPVATQMAAMVARNCGFALFLEGMNPLTVTDEHLLAQLAGRPVVRITPTGIAPGPNDPGGLGWIPALLVQIAPLVWWLLARRRRRTGK